MSACSTTSVAAVSYGGIRMPRRAKEEAFSRCRSATHERRLAGR